MSLDGQAPAEYFPKIETPPKNEKYPYESIYPEVKNHWDDPITRRDILAIDSEYVTSQVPTCVAFSVYFAINSLPKAPRVNGQRVIDSLRSIGQKKTKLGYRNTDIPLLVADLTGGKYSASVISYSDYSQKSREIDKRVSPAYVVSVQVRESPQERHDYPVFRRGERDYTFVDNSGVERKLAEIIPQFIEDNRVVEVTCLHPADVKLNGLCYVG